MNWDEHTAPMQILIILETGGVGQNRYMVTLSFPFHFSVHLKLLPKIKCINLKKVKSKIDRNYGKVSGSAFF